MSMLEKLQSGDYLPYLIGGGVVALTTIALYLRKSRNREPLLVDAPKDTVVLRQLPRGFYAPSMSPFPLKLETYLRMAKIPYRNVCGWKFSPKTKKTPWAQLNDKILTDSQLIIEHLNQYFNIDTMSHLSPNEKAIARAFRKMLEENTFWCLVRWRMVLDPNRFFSKVFNISSLLMWYITRTHRKVVYGQGMGRFQPEEMWHIYEGDLGALSNYLGDNKFLMGEKPCEVDCAIFGMLAQFKWQTPNSPLCSIMNSFPNLHAYCDRMKETFWPDWDECITHGGTKKAKK